MKTMANVIAEHLENFGDRYDLARSDSIKILASDLMLRLMDEGYAITKDGK